MNSEGNANFVQTKIPIFALGRMDLWCCGMYVARTYRACVIDLMDVVGVLNMIYLVSVKAMAMNLSTKMTLPMLRGG